MPTRPTFDRSNGWWSIRIRDCRGARVKIQLQKDPRWRKGGDWPSPGSRPRCPFDIELLARPFQDRDAAARLGVAASIPRATNLDGFLRAYVASYGVSRRPNSFLLLSRVVASWAVWCHPRGILTIERVSRADCRDYLEYRTRSGAAFNTVRTERGLLGGVFERACEDGLITVNPWRRVAVPGRDESAGTPSYSAEEVAQIANELHGWHRDLWLVGVNCGFRCEALRGLRWRDVQWSVPGRHLGLLICRAELSKGGKPYSVPLTGPLREILGARRSSAGRPVGDDLVFPGRSADGGISRQSFATILRSACRRAGIEYKGRAWHSMRATFASLCHARGVNPRAIQAWMNHTSIGQTDRYSHFSTEMEDAEASKLESGTSSSIITMKSNCGD